MLLLYSGEVGADHRAGAHPLRGFGGAGRSRVTGAAVGERHRQKSAKYLRFQRSGSRSRWC